MGEINVELLGTDAMAAVLLEIIVEVRDSFFDQMNTTLLPFI